MRVWTPSSRVRPSVRAYRSRPLSSIASLRAMTSSTSSGWRSEKNAPIEYSSVSMRDSRNESRPAGASSSSKGAAAYKSARARRPAARRPGEAASVTGYGTPGSEEVALDVAPDAADGALDVALDAADVALDVALDAADLALDVAPDASDVAPEVSGADGVCTAIEGGSGACGGAGALGAGSASASSLGASAFGVLDASGAFMDGTSAEGTLGARASPPAPATALR